MLAIAVLVALMATVQAIDWFGPQASEVTPGTSWLAFAAYGAVTAAAFWLGTTREPGPFSRRAPGDYPAPD